MYLIQANKEKKDFKLMELQARNIRCRRKTCLKERNTFIVREKQVYLQECRCFNLQFSSQYVNRLFISTFKCENIDKRNYFTTFEHQSCHNWKEKGWLTNSQLK